jgi:hypothetical protein
MGTPNWTASRVVHRRFEARRAAGSSGDAETRLSETTERAFLPRTFGDDFSPTRHSSVTRRFARTAHLADAGVRNPSSPPTMNPGSFGPPSSTFAQTTATARAASRSTSAPERPSRPSRRARVVIEPDGAAAGLRQPKQPIAPFASCRYESSILAAVQS